MTKTRKGSAEWTAGSPETGDTAAAQRFRELEALYSISTAIHASLEIDEVLCRAAHQMLDLFGFSAAEFRLLDASAGELVLAAHAGLSPELAAELKRTVRIGESASGLAAQEREIAVVADLSDGSFAGSAWAEQGYRTYVAAPLLCRGMLLGCLNMAADDVRQLPANDWELLAALMNEIAMAIANAELYAGAQRKIRQLSVLHECSRDIAATGELAQVLNLTTEKMAQLLRLERAALFFHMPETKELVGRAAIGFCPDSVARLRAPLADLPAASAILRSGETCLSTDPAAEGLLPVEFVRREELSSLLAIPLIADHEFLGLLVGDRLDDPLRLSADEMEIAVIFANQAAVWIARSRAIAEATAAESKFRDLLELAPDAILLVDGDGHIGLVNGQVEEMFGYCRQELVGEPVEMLIPERYRAVHPDHRERYRRDPRTRAMGSGLDLYARRRDGSEFPVEISLSPTSTESGWFVITIIRDVSQRRRAEEIRTQLLASEREKGEQLKLAIREAHHRIKNNLQAISDLLYLELASGAGGAAAETLRASLERIQSISLVHDLLSQDEDVQTVDIGTLSEQIVTMVLSGGRVAPEAIDAQVRVPSISLSSKKATTLALILNELVSNAVKHAFSERTSGRLQVRLVQADDGLALRVEDDGPGLPEGFDLASHSKVGLQVVRTLAERDLGGKLILSSGPGLAAVVCFPW